MKTIGSISPTITVLAGDDGLHQAACAACGHGLGPVSKGWKTFAVVRDVALADAGGPAYDTGHEGVRLRHFYCPSCATLLDTETAMEGDPFLDDRLAGS